jgi:hypothetical protein
MHPFIKCAPIIIATLVTAPKGFADYKNHKTIDESNDPNTTTIHFYLKNLTADNMVLSRPSEKFTASGRPLADFAVLPGKTRDIPADYPRALSTLQGRQPAVLSETFAYASGNKECQFTATIKVTDLLKPAHWSGTGKSIGAEPADCTTDILERVSTLPYSFSIQFSLE